MSQVRVPVWMAAALVFAVGGCTPEAGSGAVARTAIAQQTACGENVERYGNDFFVSPSGGEDTAALQCVINEGIASADPVGVWLAEGTFKTAQLVANGFRGTIRGAGMHATVITNPDRQLEAVDPGESIPTPAAPGPALLTFLDSSFEVSDLTIQIRGATPMVGWHIYGLTVQWFAQVVLVEGTHAVARFERVHLIGERANNFTGYNTVNGIYFQGWDPMVDPPPLSGAFFVQDSVFTRVGSGTPTANLRDAQVVISGNVYEDVSPATEIVDLVDSTFLFAGNRVEAYRGVDGYDWCIGPSSACGTQNSDIRVTGNTMTVVRAGARLRGTLDAEVNCLLAGNQIEVGPYGIPYYLGAGSAGCVVRP